MFQNQRFITKGVFNEIELSLQLILWNLIESMKAEEVDYLQVFTLE